MDAGSAPERVGEAHLPDQPPNFRRYARPAGTPTRFPAPEGAKACPMPPDNSLPRLIQFLKCIQIMRDPDRMHEVLLTPLMIWQRMDVITRFFVCLWHAFDLNNLVIAIRRAEMIEQIPRQFKIAGRARGGVWLLLACPCRKSDPDVMMVQSAEDRQRQNATYRLDRPR